MGDCPVHIPMSGFPPNSYLTAICFYGGILWLHFMATTAGWDCLGVLPLMNFKKLALW